MEQDLVTRTRSAQHAVERARHIVEQNNELVDKIHENFGQQTWPEDQTHQQELPLKGNREERLSYLTYDPEYKISTGSRFKNYFKEIFKSIN